MNEPTQLAWALFLVLMCLVIPAVLICLVLILNNVIDAIINFINYLKRKQ